MKRLVLGLALSTLLLVGIAYSSQTRTALVLLTQSGNSMLAQDGPRPLRTLQVLPLGAELKVASDGELRLTYFESGRKEQILGPCRLKVGAQGSEKLGSEGRIIARKSSGATRPVADPDKLRRMGGALHAKADMEPAEILALAPPIPSRKRRTDTFSEAGGSARPSSQSEEQAEALPRPAPAPVPPSPQASAARPGKASPPLSTPDEPLRPYRIPPVYAVAPTKLEWRGKGPFQVKLWEQESLRFEHDTEQASLQTLLRPGHTYKLAVSGAAGAFTKEFYVLSLQERRNFFKSVAESREVLDAKVEYAYWLESQGFLLEASTYLERLLENHPGDPGLLTALGRVYHNLGMLRKAGPVLRKAQNAK